MSSEVTLHFFLFQYLSSDFYQTEGMSGKSSTFCSPSSPGMSHDRSDFLLVPELTSVPSSSPSCLSVPSSWGVAAGTSPTANLQFDFTRRASSTASSIFDLSSEAEQLERAIRENDTNGVKKILRIHRNRFSVSHHGSYIGDKSSAESGSRCPSQGEGGGYHDNDHLRKSQTLFDQSGDRRGSNTTDSYEGLPSFRNALHIAIQHQSLDVLRLLLKSGIDPNEPGLNHVSTDGRRCSGISEILPHPKDRKDVRFLLCNNSNGGSHQQESGDGRGGGLKNGPQRPPHGPSSGSCEGAGSPPRLLVAVDGDGGANSTPGACLLRPTPTEGGSGGAVEPSGRTGLTSGGLLKPLVPQAAAAATGLLHSSIPLPQQQQQQQQQPAPHLCDRSARHDGQGASTNAPPTCGNLCSRPPPVTAGGTSTVTESAEPFSFARHYTAETLQGLPPLYLAVAERSTITCRLLLRHGACSNVTDSEGSSPLHLAASVDFQSWECALALIEHGARVHKVSRHGLAPSDLSPDLVREQSALLADTLLQATVHARQALGLPPEADPRHPEHLVGIGAKLLKRWNSENHSGKTKTKESRKQREASHCKDYFGDGSELRERTPSVSSNKSRWSWNFRFSSSPPTSHTEDIEMDPRTVDTEKVRFDSSITQTAAICLIINDVSGTWAVSGTGSRGGGICGGVWEWWYLWWCLGPGLGVVVSVVVSGTGTGSGGICGGVWEWRYLWWCLGVVVSVVVSGSGGICGGVWGWWYLWWCLGVVVSVVVSGSGGICGGVWDRDWEW